jgi:hypothetical protein
MLMDSKKGSDKIKYPFYYETMLKGNNLLILKVFYDILTVSFIT